MKNTKLLLTLSAASAIVPLATTISCTKNYSKDNLIEDINSILASLETKEKVMLFKEQAIKKVEKARKEEQSKQLFIYERSRTEYEYYFVDLEIKDEKMRQEIFDVLEKDGHGKAKTKYDKNMHFKLPASVPAEHGDKYAKLKKNTMYDLSVPRLVVAGWDGYAGDAEVLNNLRCDNWEEHILLHPSTYNYENTNISAEHHFDGFGNKEENEFISAIKENEWFKSENKIIHSSKDTEKVKKEITEKYDKHLKEIEDKVNKRLDELAGIK